MMGSLTAQHCDDSYYFYKGCLCPTILFLYSFDTFILHLMVILLPDYTGGIVCSCYWLFEQFKMESEDHSLTLNQHFFVICFWNPMLLSYYGVFETSYRFTSNTSVSLEMFLDLSWDMQYTSMWVDTYVLECFLFHFHYFTFLSCRSWASAP